MIQIDRTSRQSVHDQLVSALRFRIAGGHYRVGERLPPTRKLAAQLDLSFHTVRKAYQQLEVEGLVEARKGSGYVVRESTPLDKSERMERGAAILGVALQEVVGLGLDEEEIAYLVEEQLSLMADEEEPVKVIVAASFREMSLACARHFENVFQRPCEAITLNEVPLHADADLVVVPFRHVKQVLSMNTRGDVVGMATWIGDTALAAISRLLDHETLGLVTRFPDAVAPLTAEIRGQTKFAGQVLAMSTEEGDAYLASLVRQSELLVYTPDASRRVKPFLERAKRHVELTILPAESTVERVRSLIP